MKKLLFLLIVWFVFLKTTTVTQAAIFSDSIGDAYTASPVLDITSVEVTYPRNAQTVVFNINLDGSPIAPLDQGKYCISVRSRSGGTTNTNPWDRPILFSSGMTHWIGCWLDFGGGSQIWEYSAGAWSLKGAASIQIVGNSLIVEVPLSQLGVQYSNSFTFDVYTSTGGPGVNRGAADALSTPNATISTWLGQFSTSSPLTSICLNSPLPSGPGTSTSPGPIISNTTPVLSWQTSSGATGYGVYIRDIAADLLVYNDETFGGTDTSFQLPSGILQAGRYYRWNVRAKASGGWSDYSERLYFQTSLNPFNAPGPLETQSFSNRVELSWTDNSSNETGFKIERAINGAGWNQIATVSSDAGTGASAFYTDFSTQPRTQYSYRVRAYNTSIDSEYSNTASNVTPGGAPGGFVLSYEIPALPSGSTTPSALLRWTPSQDAGGYRIYRNGVIVAGSGGAVSPYVDAQGLTSGGTYTYFVQATNSEGITNSNSVTITMPEGGLAPSVTAIDPGTPPGLDSRQLITVRGQNFLSGAQVTLRTGSDVFLIPQDRTELISNSEIRILVNLGSTPNNWTVEVANPGSVPSTPFAFSVNGAAVSPESGVDFGTIQPGANADRIFIVRNTGTQNTGWSVAAGGAFSVVGSTSGSIPPGGQQPVTLRFTASAPDSYSFTGKFNVGGQIHQRDLTGRAVAGELVATGTVTGTVTTLTGDKITFVPNAEVILYRVNGANEQLAGRSARTDSTGSFSLSNVTTGTYKIYAKPPTLADFLGEINQTVSVQAGALADVILTLPYTGVPVPTGPTGYPVVLVRGIGGSNVDEAGYWRSMREVLRGRGFTVWDPNENAFILDGELNYSVNANKLFDFIDAQVKNYISAHGGNPPPGIHIVAHSMGGLTTRQMLTSSLSKLPPVKDVFMLSTPNAGSYLSNPSRFLNFWKWAWPSTKCLRTDLIRNQRTPKIGLGDSPEPIGCWT
ncbi:MAG: hypothetical protein ABI600_21275, partial [Luteolibacter sp.]